MPVINVQFKASLPWPMIDDNRKPRMITETVAIETHNQRNELSLIIRGAEGSRLADWIGGSDAFTPAVRWNRVLDYWDRPSASFVGFAESATDIVSKHRQHSVIKNRVKATAYIE